MPLQRCKPACKPACKTEYEALRRVELTAGVFQIIIILKEKTTSDSLQTEGTCAEIGPQQERNQARQTMRRRSEKVSTTHTHHYNKKITKKRTLAKREEERKNLTKREKSGES